MTAPALIEIGLWTLLLGVPIALLLTIDRLTGRIRLRSRDADVQTHEQQVATRLGTR